MIEQRVTLRYGAQQIPAIVQAVQGDTGRDVIFELADYEIPAGATANYYIDKPDGNAVYNSAEVISSTEILAHLTEQALAEPGRNNGQVRILSDGEVITSFDFVLEVEAFRGLMRMQSETEVNIFDEALQDAAEDAIEEIQAQTPVVTGMQNSIAPTYSASSTYAVGDYVMYNTQLYKCNTAITTAEAWTAAHWTQVPLANDVSDLNRNLNNSIIQVNDYDFNDLNKPYKYRIMGLYRPASVGESGEAYHDDSDRAVLKIPDNLVDGKIHVYNPKNYYVGVYYRKKSDNSYVDYAEYITNKSYFSITPDITTYDYYMIARYYSEGSWIIWTKEMIDGLSQSVFIYSGDYSDVGDSVPVSMESNLIKPSMIHIGKYYYGGDTPANNANMAYTDLIPIKEHRTYYMPYMTLGYSWYASDQSTVIGGDYAAVENTANRTEYLTLVAPAGASYIGVSGRSGDVPNFILSEFPNSKTAVDVISDIPVSMSAIRREPLNWVYNMDFKQNMSGSRVRIGGDNTLDGTKLRLGAGGMLYTLDQVTMDKSKITVLFAVPNNTACEFVIGYNAYYALPSLSIADGALAVLFKSDGTQAEIRMGTGQYGNYDTLLQTLDISALNIQSGRIFTVTIEKDTINKWIVSIYDALTPDNVVSATIEASQDPGNPSAYTGQIRGWGTPFVRCQSSGNVDIYRIHMYSTAPTYPKVAIWGDSYVENCGRNPLCGYGALMKQALNGNVFLSGRGGATAEQCSRRVAVEINSCSPQYIIFNVGVNDSFGVSVATFKEHVERLINMAKAKGAEPILITVPRVDTGSINNLSWITEVNPWIRSSGYRYIDVAYAMSTGDGLTADLNKYMSDKTHPNLEGGQAVFNYIKAFLPDLLWD